MVDDDDEENSAPHLRASTSAGGKARAAPGAGQAKAAGARTRGKQTAQRTAAQPDVPPAAPADDDDDDDDDDADVALPGADEMGEFVEKQKQLKKEKAILEEKRKAHGSQERQRALARALAERDNAATALAAAKRKFEEKEAALIALRDDDGGVAEQEEVVKRAKRDVEAAHRNVFQFAPAL